MPSGFEEDQTKFTGALALGEFFASYGYCCAFTGDSLRAAIDADPLSCLLRLTPLGEIRADLVIPACPDAQAAYGDGALLIGPQFNLILNAAVLREPALIARLNPDFYLRLPDRIGFAPNQLLLKEHRLAFLSG
jgi:hypothetical protein